MKSMRTIRLRPRRPADPPPSQMQPMEPIVWHETGGWSVEWQDDVEDFQSHAFARAAWLKRHLLTMTADTNTGKTDDRARA